LVPPPLGTYSLDAEGWTNHIDSNVDDSYCFVGVIDDSGHPVFLRIAASDLSSYAVILDEWGDGLGGVKCDWNEAFTLWAFGRFGTCGNKSCIQKSIDAGGNFTDVTPEDAASNVLIVNLVISEEDPDAAVALDNSYNDLYTTADGATTWVKSEAVLPFDLVPAAAAPEDFAVVFAGCNYTNAAHLQSSGDGGATWAEDSDGILPADAEITAIQALGGG
jgi:hypothetical protein